MFQVLFYVCEIFIRVSFKSSRGIDKDLIDVPDFSLCSTRF